MSDHDAQVPGDDVHDLAAAYVLDALDELERRRFEHHLEGCAECILEVAELSEVVSSFVESDPTDTADAPSPELKASTMDAIAGIAQLPPVGTFPPQDQQRMQSRDVSGPAAGATVAPASSGAAANRWPLLVAAVLVAVVAVAALGVVVSGTSANGASTEVAAVVEAPDAETVALHSDDPARAGSELAVVHSSSHSATVIVGDHVHGTGEGLVYQLWGETPNGMEPAGVFVPGEDGTVELPVDAELEDLESWNVTVEPVGGSVEPTTDIVFTSAA